MKKRILYKSFALLLCSVQIASAGVSEADCDLRRSFLKEAFDQTVPPVQLSERDKQDQQVYTAVSQKIADTLNDSWKKIQDKRLDQLLRSMRNNSGLFSQDINEDVFKKSLEGNLPNFSTVDKYPVSNGQAYFSTLEFKLSSDRNVVAAGKYSYTVEVCSSLDLRPSASTTTAVSDTSNSSQPQGDSGRSVADERMREYQNRRRQQRISGDSNRSNSGRTEAAREEQLSISFGKTCAKYNLDEVLKSGFAPFVANKIWEKSTTFPQNIRPGNILDRDAQWEKFLVEQKYPQECFGFDRLKKAGQQTQERRQESVSNKEEVNKSSGNGSQPVNGAGEPNNPSVVMPAGK